MNGASINVLSAFSPNKVLSKSATRFMVLFQVLFAIAAWFLWSRSAPIIPNPIEVWQALGRLWFQEGLGQELITSFITIFKALGYSILISLGFAYLTVTPFFRKVSALLSRCRFLGLAGLTFLFTYLVGGGEDLKVALLTFGISVFFMADMAKEVASIPKEEFDYARTLRMGEWRVVWEVVVLGKLDVAIESFRINGAAIGWTMLTMVEGIVRSEGGIGGLLLVQNKHFKLAEVFAIQFAILFVGIIVDYLIGLAKIKICPYSNINLERR